MNHSKIIANNPDLQCSIDSLEGRIKFGRDQISKLTFDRAESEVSKNYSAIQKKSNETILLRFVGLILQKEESDIDDPMMIIKAFDREEMHNSFDLPKANRFTLEFKFECQAVNTVYHIRAIDGERKVIFHQRQSQGGDFWKNLRPGNVLKVFGRKLLIEAMDKFTIDYLLKNGFIRREEAQDLTDRLEKSLLKLNESKSQIEDAIRVNITPNYDTNDCLVFNAYLETEIAIDINLRRRFKISSFLSDDSIEIREICAPRQLDENDYVRGPGGNNSNISSSNMKLFLRRCQIMQQHYILDNDNSIGRCIADTDSNNCDAICERIRTFVTNSSNRTIIDDRNACLQNSFTNNNENNNQRDYDNCGTSRKVTRINRLSWQILANSESIDILGHKFRILSLDGKHLESLKMRNVTFDANLLQNVTIE